jgi:hypothetical protein
MMERLSLADQAVARNDKSEREAIVAASPRVVFSQPDYSELSEKIIITRLCNLITRLNYIMMFDIFGIVEVETTDQMRLAAYLYVRATDSWRAVCDEISVSPDFNQQTSRLLVAVEVLEFKDSLLREFTFTESEAKDYVEKRCGSGDMKTLATETKAMREALGLAHK